MLKSLRGWVRGRADQARSAINVAWAVALFLARVVLLALIVMVALNALGLSPRGWPRPPALEVLYLCGAWWLFRGGKL